jgi:hypothetical protein
VIKKARSSLLDIPVDVSSVTSRLDTGMSGPRRRVPVGQTRSLVLEPHESLSPLPESPRPPTGQSGARHKGTTPTSATSSAGRPEGTRARAVSAHVSSRPVSAAGSSAASPLAGGSAMVSPSGTMRAKGGSAATTPQVSAAVCLTSPPSTPTSASVLPRSVTPDNDTAAAAAMPTSGRYRTNSEAARFVGGFLGIFLGRFEYLTAVWIRSAARDKALASRSKRSGKVLDEVEEAVLKEVSECSCTPPLSVQRLSEGKYLIGQEDKPVFVRFVGSDC